MKGLRLVGSLSAEVQNYTSYAGAARRPDPTPMLLGLLYDISAVLTAKRCSPPPGSNGDSS
ncbi:MAG: hypothetical protein ABW318_02510 [Vicinamibacterales bacterium]